MSNNNSISLQDPALTPFQFALANALSIEDIYHVPYPEGIKRPTVKLNIKAKGAKFIYDRAFLLQFRLICREEPFGLTPLDELDLSRQTDQIQLPKARNQAINRPTFARSPLNSGQEAVDLDAKRFGKAIASNPSPMDKFSPPVISDTRSSRFAMSSAKRAAFPAVPSTTDKLFSHKPHMAHLPLQSRPGFRTMSTASQWNKRGGDGNNNQAQPDQTQGSGSGGRLQMQLKSDSVALDVPQKQRITNSIPQKQHVDPNSLEFVGRKVKGLLNKLTMENFDSISDQIVIWENKSEKDTDGRTLIHIINLVLESAIDDEMWSEMYARLCRTMMERINPKVHDIDIRNVEGKPIAGGHLFRKYLLKRLQEDFERLWAVNSAPNQPKDNCRNENIKPEVYSDDYYAAQTARRRGHGLIRFLGELFKVQMLTERIMHKCIKNQLGNVEYLREEKIESVCKLLTTVGQILDTNRARAYMDVYFSRLKEMTKCREIRPRLRFNLQDVIDIRDRKWNARHRVACPKTTAKIHETDGASAEKELYQRQMAMAWSTSGRGGSKSQFDEQVVGGSTGPPRRPPNAGDLSNFGKMNKPVPMTFGPSSVFGKKDGKGGPPESLLSTSGSNMFSILSQNQGIAPATAASTDSLEVQH